MAHDGTVKMGARFFDFPYSAAFEGAYTGKEAPHVPNGQYAIKAHPSDIVVAQDHTARGGLIYMDQTIQIGTSDSGYAKTVEQNAYLSHFSHLHGEVRKAEPSTAEAPDMLLGHLYGFSECLWIRECRAGERLGSPCNDTQSNVFYAGYCFSSDAGTLECGRVTAVDGKPIPSHTTFRCPTGTPARTLGSVLSRRMLNAGCMISSDLLYDSFADIHVPAYCDTPLDYMAGCLLRGASNYDPTAKQNSVCKYNTAGCMASTALNYNPIAVVDNPSLPCIFGKKGCTIASVSYAGVPKDTPTYRSDYYGSALRGVGVVPQLEYNGPATLNYDDTANVMDGCMLAIEGCLDSTAMNYDSRATVNSQSWCIPRVVGCMMPTEVNADPSYSNPDGPSEAVHMQGKTPDGLNSNFSITATYHEPSHCAKVRYGCGASGAPRSFRGYPEMVAALNYDPAVTDETYCYWPRAGCLNPAALNFGCDTRDFVSPCFHEVNVTKHSGAACIYAWELQPRPPVPPAPPPAPPFPPGTTIIYVVTVRFTVGGSIEFFTTDVRELALKVFKEAAKATDLNVTLEISAASVNLDYSLQSLEQETLDSFEQNVVTAFGTTAASAQAVLGDALGVKVLRGVTIWRSTIITIPNTTDVTEEEPDDELGTVGLVIIAVSSSLFACCCVICWYCLCCAAIWEEDPPPGQPRRKGRYELSITKEKPSEETLIDNLQSRFPDVPREEIESVLQEHAGHAGRAAKALAPKAEKLAQKAAADLLRTKVMGGFHARVYPE